MTKPATIECEVRFPRQRKDSGDLRSSLVLEPGRVPRLARLMALAIRFEHVLRTGQVADYATLARLGHVSRARISQIMNLLLLASDIQEQILFLPRTQKGREPIPWRQVQALALEWDWRRQRRGWASLVRNRS